MDANAQKIELAQMIFKLRTAKGLSEVREMLENLSAMEFELSSSHIEMLEDRKQRHRSGESKSYSWKDVKADISKLRDNL